MPREDVRRDLLAFDQVVAKLDAPDERLFGQVNRPMSRYPYSLDAIVGGIRRFRQMYGGRLTLQMMFIQANAHAAPQMADLARSLEPDEVQLDTPLQPALGGPLSADEMQKVVQAFAGLPVRCIYDEGQARVQPRAM
jgi:wyosine [tRNA(Phe)-imidazoG37] synthetase (radical SAM superfamily)